MFRLDDQEDLKGTKGFWILRYSLCARLQVLTVAGNEYGTGSDFDALAVLAMHWLC